MKEEDFDQKRTYENDFFELLNMIDDAKNQTKENYKLTKNISKDNQQSFNKNIEVLINQLQAIHDKSFQFDDYYVMQDYVNKVENQNNLEQDDEINQQFLFGVQMLRGKLENLNKIKNSLNDN